VVFPGVIAPKKRAKLNNFEENIIYFLHDNLVGLEGAQGEVQMVVCVKRVV